MNSYEEFENLSTNLAWQLEFSFIADDSDGLVLVAVPTGYRKPLSTGCAHRLRGRIDASRLLRQDVAMLSGLAHQTVSAVEDGRNEPRLSTIERFGDALGISPGWLAYGDEGMMLFRPRRPRSPVPFDPPEPDPARRPMREMWRGVGPRMRQARLSLGLALRDVAEAAGISAQGVLLIERGQSDPMISTVEQLAVALNVAPSWLAFGEGQGPSYAIRVVRPS